MPSDNQKKSANIKKSSIFLKKQGEGQIHIEPPPLTKKKYI